LASATYVNRRTCNRNTNNAGDKGGLLSSWCAEADGVSLGRNTFIANIDIVVTRGEVCTRVTAQPDVIAASCVKKERVIAQSNVIAASCVKSEREAAVGRVEEAGGVECERAITDGCVLVSRGVLIEGSKTIGSVVEATAVALERSRTDRGILAAITTSKGLRPDGCIVVAGGIAVKRIGASSGVVGTGNVARPNGRSRIVIECLLAQGCVVVTGRVETKSKITDGRVGSANCVVSERLRTSSRIIVGGVAVQRKSANSCVVVAACGESESRSTYGGVVVTG
jgi:hypothetical protein